MSVRRFARAWPAAWLLALAACAEEATEAPPEAAPASAPMPSSLPISAAASTPVGPSVEEQARDLFREAAALVARDPAAAAQRFERVAELDPKGCAAYVNAGSLRERLRQIEPALALYTRATAVAKSCGDAYAALAAAEIVSGSPARAEKWVMSGLAKYPESTELRNRYVELLIQADRLVEAEREALQTLKLDERNAGAMLNLSRVYFAQKKLELARLAIDNAREIEPERGEIHHQLGVLLLQKNERPKALIAFRRAAELRPDLVPSQLNLSQLLSEAGDFEGALRAAETAVQYAPAAMRPQIALANAYRGVQRFADSELTYRKVLSSDPKNADALYNLAVLYLDAEMPELPPDVRLQKAVLCFEAFLRDGKPSADEQRTVQGYISHAKRQIEAEKKRKERDEKRKSKGLLTPASAAASAPASGPASAASATDSAGKKK